MEALGDYYLDPAIPALSDLSVTMEKLEFADWHQDLHDEIEWMREMLLPEIRREYFNICEVWVENPVSALEEDKRFLEVALEFLSLNRDDAIKWPKNECFSFMRRIKSYLLHLRDLSYGNLPAQHLDRPGCQYQTPEQPQQLNKEVSTEPPTLRKWPRLAMQHDLMYEEFQSLKEKYLRTLSQAFRMYCKFCVERGEKYYLLMWNYAFCTTFLRRPKEELLLISRDVFDFYAGRIKMLVTGVDLGESLCNNNNIRVDAKECLSNNGIGTESADASLSASSNNPTVMYERESADWHNELHKEIELMRKTELPDIKKFYRRVCEMCYQGSEPASELEKDKGFLEFALKFLSVRRTAKISWSKEKCFAVVDVIRLYALRYRNECLIESGQQWMSCGQYQNSEQQLHMKGSRDSTLMVEGTDWHEEVHDQIESLREKYLSEIEEAHRRVSMVQSESGESPIIRGDTFFLEMALKFLGLTYDDDIMVPKAHCFALLKRIEVYVLRYRKSDFARQSMQHLLARDCQYQTPDQCQQLKMEVQAGVVNPSLTTEPVSNFPHLERQSSWSADKARSEIPKAASSDPGCTTRLWQQEQHPSGNQPQFVLGA